ncbi:TPA: ead/Ea22-like family protein [Escherichia coli]|nr:ead/Ea22-like family protein [Escherichia coli]
MNKIAYQALREKAEKATWGDWDSYKPHRGARGYEVRLSSQAIAQHVLKNNAEFIAAFNPKVALALLDEREAKDKAWSAQDNHINQQADRIESLEKKNGELGRALEAAEKRIAELEKSEEQLINERDHAESALDDMYLAATGNRPEWSNWFGFSDAVDAVVDRIADLEAKQPSPVVLEGLVKAVRFYEQVKCENPPAETGAWKDAVDWVLKEACQAVNIGTKGDAGEQSDEKP